MGLKELQFTIMYKVGFTPWDGHALPARLKTLVEKEGVTPAKALDVGCGTGDVSIYLAKHGLEVTAVDFIKTPLDRARVKAKAAGVSVRFLQADATKLDRYPVGDGFGLIVDSGCMHGLSAEGRDAYVAQLNRIAVPGTRLILAGFAEGKRRGPTGFNQPEVERRFQGWELLSGGIDKAVSNYDHDPIYVYDLRKK